MDYRVGGGRGILQGVATFSEVAQKPSVLMYEERGELTLDGIDKPLEAGPPVFQGAWKSSGWSGEWQEPDQQ